MIRFDLVWFYGLSTIVGYLMSNPVYTYILNIYIYDFQTNFVENILKHAWTLFSPQLNGFKYCFITVTI